MTLALLERLASERGDDVALVDGSKTRTFAEAGERATRLANALRDLGVTAGDTVALLTGNQVEFFETILACSHIGGIYVPVNWHLVAAEIAYVLDDCEAKVAVVDERYAPELARALDLVNGAAPEVVGIGDHGDGFHDYEAMIAAASSDTPDDQRMGGPMFYTSGTTGKPKGVRTSLTNTDLTPEILTLVASSLGDWVPEGGRTLCCGPVYHSAQWAFSFLPLLNGSAVILQHKFDAAEVLDLIDRHSITNVHLVPTQMQRLVRLTAERKASFDGSSLEVVWHGAAPCPPAVKRALIDWWGPIVSEYYGSTEGTFLSRISAAEWLERGGSVGKPLANVETMVVGDDGARLGPDEVGTLYFRNLLGTDFEYHGDEQKTAAAHLEPGVFTTGDVGYIDEDGYLWLSDRRIDMIISGGVNIYPAEIEAVLSGHDDVEDVAVIGVPNEEWGEEVKAVVALTPDSSAEDELRRDLLELCGRELAGYKRPRSIDFVDRIPRTETGKLLKRELRDPYWEGLDRSI